MLLLKLGGTNPTTGVRLLISTGCSEGIGKERGEGGLGRDVALYIKKWTECKELSLKNGHKQESLWVSLGDQGNKGNLVFAVCYGAA